MGRWRLTDVGQRQMTATVGLTHDGDEWAMKRKSGVKPFASSDPDTQRIWWTDVGVHQNLTFPVHPDPISGMHCWHQAVVVTKARAEDAYGDIAVDTEKSKAVYEKWLTYAHSAEAYSPDQTRRPYWLLRPLKPGHDAFALPAQPPAPRA